MPKVALIEEIATIAFGPPPERLIRKPLPQPVEVSAELIRVGFETVRVQGAKRDDLQSAIALLKSSVDEVPLQLENFRD